MSSTFAPTGHVRNVQDVKSGKYYSIVGPEGAISFKLRTTSRETYGVNITSHMREPRDWLFDAQKCDLLGGECYGDSWWLGGDRAYEALRRDPAELWALLEECYTDMVLRVDDGHEDDDA